MNIKLITGATAYEAAINTIEKIDTKDFDVQNLVVVPDSFSMQAESLIFDVLKIKSTFNIEVVGISRLASKILRNNNVSFQRINSLEEVFAIFNVVKENEGKFVYFKKCGLDFCLKILQIVKQFKGCKIKPEQIKSVGDEMLDAKMQDLKLIFQAYEEKLANKLDLSRLLEFFAEKAENELNLSKIKLFFVNFDSFSTEINSFICKLAGLVNQVYIGYSKPISIGNAFIYEDDIFKKTTMLAKEYGVTVGVESQNTKLSDENLTMVKNLFSFDVEKGRSDFFVNILAKNMQDEIDFVAKMIRFQVFKGKRFKNFAVAVSDKSYFEQVSKTFARFGITSYCDEAVDLSQTILGQKLLKILHISKSRMAQEVFLHLPSILDLTFKQRSDIVQQIRYKNIDNEEEFLAEFPNFENLIALIKSIQKCKTVSNYIECLKQFVEIFMPNYEKIIASLDRDLQFKKSSENEQALELVNKVLEKLENLAEKQEISLYDFQTLLEMSFKTVKVETIPSYIDAVYVGDVTESYFEDVDTLFVLGATSSLPKARNDTGIIDDNDIAKLRLNFALEPEIKVINRRARLKLFETLQHAKKHLFVSTPASEGGRIAQKAGFVLDLCKMFGENVVATASMQDILLIGLSSEERLDKVLFNLGCKSNFAYSYSKLKSGNKLPMQIANEIDRMIGDRIPKLKAQRFLNEENSQILLANNVISASQLENYFICPFKHFVAYGLNVKPFENIEPNKRKFGIFQHAILEAFIKKYKRIEQVDSQEIEVFIKENYINIAEKIYDNKLLNKKHFLNYLANESKIILKNIVFEQKNSNFRPFLTEKKIFNHFYQDVNLIGYVDRTDVCGKYFRIIDYKTGKTEGLKKDLYYGKKLQLFLYADAIANELSLDCAGVYYFDCQTKYVKSGANQTLLNGITKKENDVVLNTDKRLWEEGVRSDLIGVSMKKNPKPEEFAYKNGNTEENLEVLFSYAKNVSCKAIAELKKGYVEAKPLKGECQFCPYLSVCRHENENGVRLLRKINEI